MDLILETLIIPPRKLDYFDKLTMELRDHHNRILDKNKAIRDKAHMAGLVAVPR